MGQTGLGPGTTHSWLSVNPTDQQLGWCGWRRTRNGPAPHPMIEHLNHRHSKSTWPDIAMLP
jgi:hypothetical protein